MASSSIDWDGALEFEDGRGAALVARLSHTGKCAYLDGRESVWADSFASLYERGARYLVASKAASRQAAPYSAAGHPVVCWDNDNRLIYDNPRLVQQRGLSTAEQEALEAMAGWGTF
jgi:hypothetical protein